MTAQYWTMTGFDIWRLGPIGEVELENLVTGEKLACVIKIPEG